MTLLSFIAALVAALAWPIVALIALLLYGNRLVATFDRSKVKLSLFGVEIETSEKELEKVLTASVEGQLTPEQWQLLEKIWRDGRVSVQREGFTMSMTSALPWIRPIRNAGLIMTLPDGKYIEEATDLVLTPLGDILMAARRGR